MKIAERLREGRLAKGLTQKDAADAISNNVKNIASYESGRTRPTLEVLRDLIELYELDPLVLLELSPQHWNKIPVYGIRTRKEDFFMEDNIQGYEFADVDDAKGHFFVRVQGDSMVNERLHDGDYALIKRQNFAEDGDIAAAFVGEEGLVLRVYKEAKGGFILMTAGAAPDAMFVPLDKNGDTPDHVEIQGVMEQTLIKRQKEKRKE